MISTRNVRPEHFGWYRPYMYHALGEIARCAESHFCPRVVDAFLRISDDPEFERAFAA